jgi:hypothetical protein
LSFSFFSFLIVGRSIAQVHALAVDIFDAVPQTLK